MLVSRKASLFLQGGGQMGELTRNFNWLNSTLGAPDGWPLSLRTTVSNILRSKFPMFLWWGEEMIQFYNDAYRPSLGNEGKHPHALGQKGVECWPEIWEIITPLLNQVKKTGEATWMEDQLVPIFRNGAIEDVYWTFSYSSVLDDYGNHGGILVTCTETTEKVNNLKRLKESEDRLLFTIEAAELGTWDYNPLTNKFTGNNRLKEWFGVEPEGEIDLSLTIDHIIPNDRLRVKEAIQKALQFESGGSYEIEYTIENSKTGKQRIVVAKGRAYFTEDKIAYRFNGTLHDVTEKALALEKLKHNEQNLRNTILQAPVAMTILRGPEFLIEIANERMYELWGRTKEEMFGKFLFEALPEARQQGYEQLLSSVYNTGKSYYSFGSPVNLLRNKKVEEVYVNLLYEPFRESNGTISGIMVVANDVTEQVVAKIRLEESNKEFQFVTDFLPQMIWATRADGYHYFYNKQWYDYTGLTFDQTKDTGWNAVFHPEDQDRAWKLWRHSLETGEPYDIEYRCRRFDGEYRWVLGRALPLKDETGKILKWFGTCTDVHDHKMAAELLERRVEERTNDLRLANANLKKLNADLEQFTYITSHDLQEPLRKIIIFADMMKGDSYDRLSNASQLRLDKIITAGSRMRAALRDVLNYARLGINEQFQKVDLEDVLATVYSDLELLIDEKKAILQSDALPTVNAIPAQMHQLFYNLINNAIKFSKPTEPPVITISCSKLDHAQLITYTELDQTKEYYSITIKDNGIGFTQESENKIFDMFQRLHNKEDYPGTGIGLALCRKVLSNHNGIIRATGKIDEGAVFEIVIPN